VQVCGHCYKDMEILDGQNKYKCGRCRTYVKAEKAGGLGAKYVAPHACHVILAPAFSDPLFLKRKVIM